MPPVAWIIHRCSVETTPPMVHPPGSIVIPATGTPDPAHSVCEHRENSLCCRNLAVGKYCYWHDTASPTEWLQKFAADAEPDEDLGDAQYVLL